MRMESKAMDTLQLYYSPQHSLSYHLEVLDHLQELVRDGLIRSVSVANFPSSLLLQAAQEDVDLVRLVESNQLLYNLLNPNTVGLEEELVFADLGIKLLLNDPLAGGLLTDRHYQAQHGRGTWKLTASERQHVKTSLAAWLEHNELVDSSSDSWSAYQSKLLPVLAEIAWKHQVSIASVFLRWTLQDKVDIVASTVVPLTSLVDDDDWSQSQEALRQVFSFELDQDDTNRLDAISGRERPPVVEDEFEDDDNDWVPDFSNTALWL